MAGTWHDNEIITELTLWANLRNTAGTRLQLHLFTDAAPPITDDFDCTALTEPTFPGYAPQFLDGWTVPPVEGGEPALWTTTAAAVRFCRTVTGACQTVYGYFLTREDDGKCAGAELAWPSGILFCTQCDCEQVQVSKTEQDLVPGD